MATIKLLYDGQDWGRDLVFALRNGLALLNGDEEEAMLNGDTRSSRATDVTRK